MSFRTEIIWLLFSHKLPLQNNVNHTLIHETRTDKINVQSSIKKSRKRITISQSNRMLKRKAMV